MTQTEREYQYILAYMGFETSETPEEAARFEERMRELSEEIRRKDRCRTQD